MAEIQCITAQFETLSKGPKHEENGGVKLPREEGEATVVSTTWSSVAGSFWPAANGQIGAASGGWWLNV